MPFVPPPEPQVPHGAAPGDVPLPIRVGAPSSATSRLTTCSLVIPVYMNEGTIDELMHTLEELSVGLERRLEVIFVVDGSPDNSYTLIRNHLEHVGFPAELVRLSRNFGSFAAIRMGLSLGRGPYFAVMAADLQEPPELVLEFFRALEREPVDLAVGMRTDRDDPPMSRLSSNLFWSFYRRLVQREMPVGGIDVFGCNRAVRDALLLLEEANSSLVGQVVWLGFRRKCVPYHRRQRKVGKSGWTFRRKLRYMLDSIFSFTDLPLTLLMLVGSVGLVFSLAITLVVLVAWLSGRILVPGYTPIILTASVSTFAQLLGLGVIGAYVWRTFENTKRRPLYIPMLRESFPQDR